MLIFKFSFLPVLSLLQDFLQPLLLLIKPKSLLIEDTFRLKLSLQFFLYFLRDFSPLGLTLNSFSIGEEADARLSLLSVGTGAM